VVEESHVIGFGETSPILPSASNATLTRIVISTVCLGPLRPLSARSAG
jgi:hypothetical protein